MQLKITGSILRRLATAAFLFTALIPAVAQDRIAHAISSSERAELHGNVHPLARPEFDQGAVRGSMMLHRMVLTFSPSAPQQANLEALLAEQQNPLSPFYHQWLTPEQYADRFGMSASDLASAVDWLRSQGFTIDETARSRTYIAFSGSASQVESAFNTSIHQFEVNGELHYANVSNPALPWPLANVAQGIHGLNDFRPKARGIAHPRFTSSISGSHFIAPDDFATIYNLKPLYAAGIDGSGQKIAIMGQTDLILTDISTFRSVSGLPANQPTVVLVTGSADPGVVSGDIIEANLDVQWAGAVAPNANIIYVNSKNGAFDSMLFAVSHNTAPIISISYGDCEPDFSNSEISTLVSMGQQANAQGQTIVGPSGDSGAADCDFPPNSTTQVKTATHGLTVDIPAALPYATGVGGTTFNEGSGNFWSGTNNSSQGSAVSYIPESGWNDTTFEIANGGSLAATGGGISNRFAKPSWQAGVTPNDSARDVPDIAFSASFDHDGYLVCSQSKCVNGYRASDTTLTVVGGTSAGAPVFSGIVALMNQYSANTQGNVNPTLYQVSQSTPSAFHDITSGDNKVPCTSGSTDCPSGTTQIGFSAGPGYDYVTGLGSLDANKFVLASASPVTFLMSASASTMTLTAGTTGNVGTANLTLSSQNGFSGTVALSCTVASTLPRTICAVPNSVTLPGSGSATVTITAPTSRSSLRAPHLFPHMAPWSDGTFALAFGLMLAGKRERCSKYRKLALVAVLVFFAIGMMVGCGGGGSSSSSTTTTSQTTTSTVTGTGAVIVTATSGGFTRAVTITVTVN